MKDNDKPKQDLPRTGEVLELKNFTPRQPVKFSGPFDSQKNAWNNVHQLENQSWKLNQWLYVEKIQVDWWIMVFYNKREWDNWWEQRWNEILG